MLIRRSLRGNCMVRRQEFCQQWLVVMSGLQMCYGLGRWLVLRGCNRESGGGGGLVFGVEVFNQWSWVSVGLLFVVVLEK